MHHSLIFGIVIIIVSIVIMLLGYFLGYYRSNKEKKCTIKTVGKIIRYSSYNVTLPVVEYTVNNEIFKVKGPRFQAVISKTISNPFRKSESTITSNLTTREELPNVLKITIRHNSFISVLKNPLCELYPIGSDVDVYYDPDKPKNAYVQRTFKPHWIYTLLLIIGIIGFICGIICLLLYFIK